MICPKCGSNGYNLAEFTQGEHGTAHWHCKGCDHEETTRNKRERCPRCHKEYWEVAWYMPSGCSKCCYSFVD